MIRRLYLRFLKRFFFSKWLKEVEGAYDLRWVYSRVCLSGFESGLDETSDQAFHDAIRSELASIGSELRKEVLSQQTQ